VVVGVFMVQSAVEIDMKDFATAAPAVLTLLAIPLTFSIAEGIGLGLMATVVLALGTGRARTLPVFTYLMALVFFLQFFGVFPFSG
jgi:AGZA family xanthine/uracil permease-like MFS transporter